MRYCPREDSAALVMHNGNLLAFEAGSQRGFGVRVLYRGAWGFAAGSDLDAIPAVFTRALDNAKTAALRLKRPIRLADKQVHTGRFSSLKALKTFASLSKSFFVSTLRALRRGIAAQRAAYPSVPSSQGAGASAGPANNDGRQARGLPSETRARRRETIDQRL